LECMFSRWKHIFALGIVDCCHVGRNRIGEYRTDEQSDNSKEVSSKSRCVCVCVCLNNGNIKRRLRVDRQLDDSRHTLIMHATCCLPTPNSTTTSNNMYMGGPPHTAPRPQPRRQRQSRRQLQRWPPLPRPRQRATTATAVAAADAAAACFRTYTDNAWCCKPALHNNHHHQQQQQHVRGRSAAHGPAAAAKTATAIAAAAVAAVAKTAAVGHDGNGCRGGSCCRGRAVGYFRTYIDNA
jgi:hypothetical protein